jgi:hypothetical protein
MTTQHADHRLRVTEDVLQETNSRILVAIAREIDACIAAHDVAGMEAAQRIRHAYLYITQRDDETDDDR